MRSKLWTLAMIAVVAAATAAVAGAGAMTQVEGAQYFVADEGPPGPVDDVWGMSGSLVGDMITDSWSCHAIPGGLGETWPCRGTEHFVGCLDESGDGTCNQEASGRLDLEFIFTATPVGNGRCHHPIVSGSGAFEGATGQLTFKDRLGVCGIKTTYKGHISLG